MKKYLLILFSLSLILVVLSFFLEISQIHGTNMEPNIKNKQMVLWRKSFSAPSPNRADIILYYPKTDNRTPYIGRVVGIPGESVRIQNGNIYIDNGQEKYRIEEQYISSIGATKATQEAQWFQISKDEYFIASDNRTENIIDIQNKITPRADIKGVLFLKL